MYGRGTASVAEQIGSSVEEAQQLVDKFFNGFPTVRDWIEKTRESARKLGYVEDVAGRRRRLPDIQLPKYQIIPKEGSEFTEEFNPLLYAKPSTSTEDNPILKHYEEALKNVKGRKDFAALKEQAAKDCPQIELKDNSGFIAEAERQCVNARVQGGASTISKTAMINVARDAELNRLGFRILICVHDEIIGECPRENAEKVGKRLSQLMIESAAVLCSVPMKCDTYCISRWYEDDFSDYIHGRYEDMSAGSGSAEEVRAKLLEDYPMISPAYLEKMMQGTYECNVHEDI